MQFYRFASWLYVVVGSLALPALVLDMCLDWPGLTTLWCSLFGLSVPLMVVQIFGLRRVLHERAAFDGLSGLLTWYWALHLVGALLLALAVGLYLAGQGMWAFWTLLIAALPMLGVGVGVGVVELVLGIRLAKYPDALFGLQRALHISFIALGALELANLVIFISLPFYAVVAMALMFLIAFIIEGHAREQAPSYGQAQVWISYLLASVLMVGPPLAGLPVLIKYLDERPGLLADDYDDDEDEDSYVPRNPNKRDARH